MENPLTHRLFSAVLVLILEVAAPVVLAQNEATDPVALLRLAHEQRKAGDFSQAINGYQQALQLAHASKHFDAEWQARTFLALSYKEVGKSDQALRLHEENLAFVRQHMHELVAGAMNREVDSLQSLASDYASLGNLSKAAQLLTEALSIVERTDTNPGSQGKAKLTQKLGIVQFLSGDAAQAEKTLSASLAEFETALQTRLAAGMPPLGEYESEVEVIRWLQKSLVAQNRTDEALELAEKGRSRAFAALLAGRLGVEQPRKTLELIPMKDRPDTVTIAPQPLEKALSVSEMKRIAAEQRSMLVEYSILYKYDPDLPLEFSDYTKIPATDLLIWLINPSGQTVFRQTKIDPPLFLVDLVGAAREAIGAGRGRMPKGRRRQNEAGELAPEVPQLRQLHHLLIQPIADLLPADPVARVTFLPQDLLFLVPFAALQDDADKFLIEQHTIAAGPSIKLLASTRQLQEHLPETTRGGLVVGNPTMPSVNGQPLPPLPGAEAEAKAVAGLLKAPLLVGGQATKKAVVARMPHARVIHLATHGLLDDAGGEFSSLALAPADGDQGFLTARELVALKLNAELVVLSACDTGLGRITGDGVVGLSRALIGAGASSVLVSLWAVPDVPTTFLMSAFYQGLENGADKAQALRQAMLATMRRYPSPVNWAAFTLVGDTEVSKTLRTAMARGMGGDNAGSVGAPVTSARYAVFPVPEEIENYTEWPSAVAQGQVDITFDTAFSLEDLMGFYRNALVQSGLQEDRNLTRREEKSFTLVFTGSASGRKLVVQGTDMTDLGGNRAVSVRFDM